MNKLPKKQLLLPYIHSSVEKDSRVMNGFIDRLVEVDKSLKNRSISKEDLLLNVYDADTTISIPNSDSSEYVYDSVHEEKVTLYRIGGMYGYRAFMNVDTRIVYFVDYEEPRMGGIIFESVHLGVECDYSKLKNLDIDVYNRIINIKNGTESLLTKYSVKNDKGTFGCFEKWELDYPINKDYFNESLHPFVIETENRYKTHVWLIKN